MAIFRKYKTLHQLINDGAENMIRRWIRTGRLQEKMQRTAQSARASSTLVVYGPGSGGVTAHTQLTNVLPNQHHAQVHALIGSNHTLGTLTAGQLLRALTDSTVGFADGGLLTGEGAPAAELGLDGDCYLDTLTNELYAHQSGSWALVATLGGGSSGIADNAVLVDHLARGTQPRSLDMLIADPGFEVTQGDPAALVWWFNAGGPCTIAQVTGDGDLGACCLQFSARTEADTAAYIFALMKTLGSSNHRARIPVRSTDVLLVEGAAKLQSGSGGEVAVVVQCFDATMTQLADVVALTWEPPAGTWERKTAKVGAGQTLAWPSGTRYIRFQVRDTSSSTTAVTRVSGVTARRVPALSELGDVDLTGLGDGDLVKFDLASGTFVPITLADLAAAVAAVMTIPAHAETHESGGSDAISLNNLEE